MKNKNEVVEWNERRRSRRYGGRGGGKRRITSDSYVVTGIKQLIK